MANIIDLSKLKITYEGEPLALNLNDLCIHNLYGKVCIHPLIAFDPSEPSPTSIAMNGSTADVIIGAPGYEGDLHVRDRDNRSIFHVDGRTAVLTIGAQGNEGDITLKNAQNRIVFRVDGNESEVRIGTLDNEGNLIVRDGRDRDVFVVNGSAASVIIGNNDNGGDLSINDREGRTVFRVEANTGAVHIGTEDRDGDLFIRDSQDRQVFRVEGNSGNVRIGTTNNEGTLEIRDNAANTTIQFDGQSGNIFLNDNAGNLRIQLDPGTGDIRLSGADCAEDFDIAPGVDDKPGTVMIMDDGYLRPATKPYDHRVAGVISGAGHYTPGIRLDSHFNNESRAPLALLGKVFCKTDADYGTVNVGDLLTTSPTSGYAMKVNDRSQAMGAIIGKAMKPLKKGKGIIPILICLQ